MKTRLVVAAVVSIAILWIPVLPVIAAETKPAGKDVPKKTLKQIESQFQRPRTKLTRAQTINLLTKRMEKVLVLGAEAEKNYPTASNLYEVRSRMLRAADFLAGTRRDDESRNRLMDIAGCIVASDISTAEKVQADFFITRSKVQSSPKAAGQIRNFAKRYEKTAAAGTATVYAVILARDTGRDKLRNEMLDTLEAKYSDDGDIRTFLRRMGRSPYVGKPFQARLTRLNGAKLTLPADLLGKVVVIDFWATWCRPCLPFVPHLKKIYAKHKDQGLEIVSISLDTRKRTLTDFIRKNEMTWVHAFSGKGWQDPTTRKYGVEGIPSVWVIGRDGKVVSDSARGQLEKIIAQALKAPAPGKKD